MSVRRCFDEIDENIENRMKSLLSLTIFQKNQLLVFQKFVFLAKFQNLSHVRLNRF